MSGAATAPGGDPSMEDILASIRKILNEEEAAPAAPATEAQASSVPAPEPEPLELTEAMLVATPAAEVEEVAPSGAAASDEPRPEPEPEPELPPTPEPALALSDAAPLEATPSASVSPGGERLVGPATEAAAVALLGQLARSVAAERAAPIHRGGPSIEDVVREEVRPILKAWMDEHLPPLVERLVRAEIERVASRSLG